MSKYLHKLDYQVVVAKQIVKKVGNEIHFNNGDVETYPERSHILLQSNIGDWAVSSPIDGDRLMSPQDFNRTYENYFEKEEA
jgi:hypothetical protein